MRMRSACSEEHHQPCNLPLFDSLLMTSLFPGVDRSRRHHRSR